MFSCNRWTDSLLLLLWRPNMVKHCQRKHWSVSFLNICMQYQIWIEQSIVLQRRLKWDDIVCQDMSFFMLWSLFIQLSHWLQDLIWSWSRTGICLHVTYVIWLFYLKSVHTKTIYEAIFSHPFPDWFSKDMLLISQLSYQCAKPCSFNRPDNWPALILEVQQSNLFSSNMVMITALLCFLCFVSMWLNAKLI